MKYFILPLCLILLFVKEIWNCSSDNKKSNCISSSDTNSNTNININNNTVMYDQCFTQCYNNGCWYYKCINNICTNKSISISNGNTFTCNTITINRSSISSSNNNNKTTTLLLISLCLLVFGFAKIWSCPGRPRPRIRPMFVPIGIRNHHGTNFTVSEARKV